MKLLSKVTAVLILLVTPNLFGQEKNIDTHSIKIDNLIPYIVDNYKGENASVFHLTFLIQTSENTFSIEDNVVLKQALRLLSKRLKEEDKISILSYGAYSGIALSQCSIKKDKKILNTIENFKSSIKTLHTDGIALAYEQVNSNFNPDAINRIVMIRIPNKGREHNVVNAPKEIKKKKGSAIVLTTIALLPELISVLKD